MKISIRKETYTLKKFLKWFFSLAIVGTIIGLVVAYLLNDDCDDFCDEDDFQNDEDEDFDLDSDLQPVPDRSYVSLKKAEEKDVEEPSEEDCNVASSNDETEE